MNRKETAALLAVMTTIWDYVEADDNTITAWHWALDEMPYALVEEELKRWIRTERRAPRPADLLERIAEGTVALPTPEAAWGMVLDRMAWPAAVNGILRVWAVPDAVRLALKQVGSINTLRQSETPAADRKAFLAAYTAVRRQEVEQVQTGERPPALRRVAPGVFANDAAIRRFLHALDVLRPPDNAAALSQER